MTVHFALRSRIRLRDAPPRSRDLRLPPLALPIASYWAIMGLLTYGVASGALRPERLASLRLVSAESFTSPRLSLEPSDALRAAPAPTEGPAEPPAPAPAASAEPASTVPSPGPLAGLPPASDETQPPMDTSQEAPVPKTAVRPLAGFSLSSPIQDDDGDRGSYAAITERDREADESIGPSHARARESDGMPRVAARVHASDEEPALATGRAPLRNVPELPTHDVSVPVPSEFQPAPRRAAVAMRAPDRRDRAVSLRRANPDDPYPGFRDDDAPAPTRPDEPRELPREAPEERPSARPRPAPRAVSSCEAAIAGANEEMDFSKSSRGAPDVTRGAYAAVLDRGSYLLPCGVPAGMTLDVCTAVRDGHAVGITVVTRPANGGVAACVRNAVAAIVFPKSPRLDVTRTRFDSARGR
jgi:hypothetical protein